MVFIWHLNCNWLNTLIHGNIHQTNVFYVPSILVCHIQVHQQQKQHFFFFCNVFLYINVYISSLQSYINIYVHMMNMLYQKKQEKRVQIQIYRYANDNSRIILQTNSQFSRDSLIFFLSSFFCSLLKWECDTKL